MTRGAPRTVAVPKPKATVYLRRARNLLEAMNDAEKRKNSDAVATNGVQASIAFADAFTIAKLGLRCRGQDHQEVVGLISRVGTESAANLAAKVQAVLNRKTEVEYGERDVSLGDANRIASTVREIDELVGLEFP